MSRWFAITLAWIVSLVGAFFLGDYYGVQDVASPSGKSGRFIGRLTPEWLDGGREMKLTDDFIFVDPRNQAWLAPRGSVINGASIPRALWTLIGGPFEGKYRNASVVHDVACEQMKQPHADVHRMFFDACLAGGVPEREAKRLYWAVARFGPRWAVETRVRTITMSGNDGPNTQREVIETVSVPIQTDEVTAEDLDWANRYFDQNNPSADEIPFLTP